MTMTNRFFRRVSCGACLFLALFASSCVDTATAPTGQLGAGRWSSSGFIWALIVDPSGGCIPGASVYVVSGPYAGQTFEQDSECDAWSYSGGVFFSNLPVGETMTLRASAAGYASMEKTAVAATSGQAVEFDLTPLP